MVLILKFLTSTLWAGVCVFKFKIIKSEVFSNRNYVQVTNGSVSCVHNSLFEGGFLFLEPLNANWLSRTFITKTSANKCAVTMVIRFVRYTDILVWLHINKKMF